MAAARGWRHHAEGLAALRRRSSMPEEVSPLLEGWRLWAPHTMVEMPSPHQGTVVLGRPLDCRHKDVEYQQKTGKKERAADKAITMAL